MFKKSLTRSNIQCGRCCKIFLLVLFAVNEVESSICEENKPCQGRGGCFIINEESPQPGFLSTKCVCARGYSGRWCQFRENGIKLDQNETKQLKGLPGSPTILTRLSTISHESSYNLTWKEPGENSTTPILYYAVRYRLVGESNWRNVDEILASEAQKTYSYVFQSLYWDVDYEVDIYAGSSQGVGKPASGIIRRPKVEYPEITYVSKEKIGDDAILANTQFRLRCEVRGQPSPSLSWTLNGKRLSGQGVFSVADGNLTVLRASINEHRGVYRCVATNKWGSVMSRQVKVTITAPVKFLSSHKNHGTKTKQVFIGEPVYFNCPRHSPMSSSVSYKWGNRDGNSSNDFVIETSERVWITANGMLVFDPFKQEDADLLREKGIRCIIEQRTSSGKTTTMSNVFKVRVEKHFPSPAKRSRLEFLERPQKNVALLRGQTLELRCSARGNSSSGKILIEWGVDSGKTKRFPNGVKTPDFGRVLNYKNVQMSDSGKIVCKAFQLSESGNDTRYVITSQTFLKVLDRPEDVYKKLPRKVSVYSSSTLRLGPSHAAGHVFWYYNGKRLNNKKAYLEFGGGHFGSKNGNSGVYQVDHSFGDTSFTSPIYVQFIDDETLEETIQARSGLHLYCVHPTTFSLPDIEVTFSPTCRSKVSGNSITITEETAWKHNHCGCKAFGDFYSVSRKFDMDGAMFSSHGTWVWSQWSPWSHCPTFQEMCGQNIFISRHRTCYNPTPNLDGEYCSGNTKQKQRCPFIPCEKKVPSFWTQWSTWSDCSNLCGDGTRSRRRMCVSPTEGACPEGDWHEKKACVGAVCFNVEGEWGEWSKWSQCSKTCGIGMRRRQRHCSKSAQSCIGRSRDHVQCFESCKFSKEEDEESTENEIYSKGIFFIPNTLALFTAVFLTCLGISMAVQNCCKKSRKKSKHKRLLQDLFHKPDLDIERQPLLETETKPPPAKKRPPTRGHRHANLATQKSTASSNDARLKHKAAKYGVRPKRPVDSSRKDTSGSLAPVTLPGNLPPPSPSLLAPSGGIGPPQSPPVQGSVPPGGAPPPPPPPPPPGLKR